MTTNKNCAICCSKIDLDALKCIECDEYQSAWRRWAMFAAKSAGVLTLSIAAITYIADSIPRVVSKMFPSPSAHVISFVHNKNLTLLNNSEGALFVKHVKLIRKHTEKEHYGTASITISKIVPAGELMTHKFKNDDQKGWETMSGESNSNNKNWIDVTGRIGKGDSCYRAIIYKQDEPEYNMIKVHYIRRGTQALTMPHGARVVYYSQETGQEHSQDFNVVGLLMKSPSEECKEFIPPENAKG